MKTIIILLLAVGFSLNISAQETLENASTDQQSLESTEETSLEAGAETAVEAEVETIVDAGPDTAVETEVETVVENGNGTSEDEEEDGDESDEQMIVEADDEMTEEAEDETSVEEISTGAEVDKTEMNPLGECPEVDNENPTYLSDRKNCSVFYECSGGVPHKLICRYPLEFNPDMKICDSPLDSGCLIENDA